MGEAREKGWVGGHDRRKAPTTHVEEEEVVNGAHAKSHQQKKMSSPRPAAPLPPWAVSAAAAAAAAGTDPDAGLTEGEAAARRAAHGPNELARDPPTPMWKLVLAQFDDMLVKVRVRGGGSRMAGTFCLARLPEEGAFQRPLVAAGGGAVSESPAASNVFFFLLQGGGLQTRPDRAAYPT